MNRLIAARRYIRSLSLLLLATLAVAVHPARADFVAEQMVVLLQPGVSIDAINQQFGTSTLDAFVEGDLYLITIPPGTSEEVFESQLADHPDVVEADENFFQDTPEGIRQMVISATGGTFGDFEDQDASVRVGLDDAHALATGSGVVVGVLDTGIDTAHPAFAGKIHPDAFDFIDNDTDLSEVANGLDDDGDGEIDDGFGHGTMVAGIIALVAPDATILPLRVLDDEGRGEAFTIAKAIRYAQLRGAHVLNLSFGVPQDISSISTQIEIVNHLGVTVVSGAGNENQETPTYFPAKDSDVIMVTALNNVDGKAGFADFNSKVLVSAPGVGIRSAYPGGGWGLGSGCSFAAPFVAGEAALILDRYPSMPPETVETIVEAAVDYGLYSLPQNDGYEGKLGSGRIYLPMALSGTPVTAVPDGDPVFMTRLLAAPNPARGRVALQLLSPTAISGDWEVEIFDPAGRLVRRLDGSGSETVVWNGRDRSGRDVPGGIYFARTRGTRETSGTRIVWIR